MFFIQLRVSLASINRFLFRLKAVPASTCQYAVRIVNLRSRLLIRKPPPTIQFPAPKSLLAKSMIRVFALTERLIVIPLD